MGTTQASVGKIEHQKGMYGMLGARWCGYGYNANGLSAIAHTFDQVIYPKMYLRKLSVMLTNLYIVVANLRPTNSHYLKGRSIINTNSNYYIYSMQAIGCYILCFGFFNFGVAVYYFI